MVSPLFRFLRSATNGGGVVPSRPIARGANTREAELRAELDALRAEQAAMVRRERTAAANLDRMRDSLDVLAGEIDKRAKASRDPDLAKRGAVTIASVKTYLSQQGDYDIKPSTVAAAIRTALGLEASSHRFAAPRAPAAASAQPAAVRADPQAIIDAGNRAAGRDTSTDVRTGAPKPLPSPLTRIDPTAAGIVRAGRRARNEPTDE